MSSPSLALPLPPTLSNLHSKDNPTPEIPRRSADFEPSIWGDLFLECSYEKMLIDASTQQVEELKEKVRPMLSVRSTKQSSKILNLIDTLQRLGVAYHFEVEIHKALEQVFYHSSFSNYDDLYTTALHFRLLRQGGYHISSDLLFDCTCFGHGTLDVFAKFKDNNDNFKTHLINDVPGMLSLYEAAHLRVCGEEILDEALDFTTTHLVPMVNQANSLLEKQVSCALIRPVRKNMPRLEARQYIEIYQEDDDKHNKLLLQFAKLDFNLVQSIHLKELSDLSKWWKGLQFSPKLPFARDRLVECYFWIIGVYFEPKYALARNFLTKVMAMTSIIDDIYDVYGTLEELNLFTQAIERWNISAIDPLPEYMKVCYRALLDVYDKIEDALAKDGRVYRLHYAKEAMKELVKAYLLEEKWRNEGYIPTTEEYMKNALISNGYPMLAVTSFVGMGDIVPAEAFQWVKNDIIPVKATAVICRLMNDIVSHEYEQKRGHVVSAVECYMKEYNVTEEDARNVFNKRVDEAWQDLNQGCLNPTVVPMPLLERVVNFSRMVDLIYKHEDGYVNSRSILKEYISSLLIDRFCF